MRTSHGLGELMEERILDFGEFPRIHYLEYILDFIKKHDLFGAVYLWPVSQQPQDDLHRLLGTLYCVGTRLLTSSVKAASFSKNCTIQYASWGWYMLRLFTLCRGINTRVRNNLCSSFNGRAKPLIIDPRISNSSAIPLNRSVS